ncbi:hypothetical protein [Moraxella sp.]|uniref:hypothetical protein n=1 Tax=Moraxella sp. TaxID=479 RepID=UPI0026DC44AB|nr:hypothetical protein [Moraxella sp.]MDO4894994.1 hypothetical protein [Moraxella sp.]
MNEQIINRLRRVHLTNEVSRTALRNAIIGLMKLDKQPTLADQIVSNLRLICEQYRLRRCRIRPSDVSCINKAIKTLESNHESA